MSEWLEYFLIPIRFIHFSKRLTKVDDRDAHLIQTVQKGGMNMQLTIVPLSQSEKISRLTDRTKKDLLKTIEHMELEIDRLSESSLALDEAKKIVITEQLEGMKLALILTGHTLIYQ